VNYKIFVDKYEGLNYTILQKQSFRNLGNEKSKFQKLKFLILCLHIEDEYKFEMVIKMCK
jgi:hypothetical protein